MIKRGRNKILIVLYYYYPYVSGVSVYAKRVAEGLVELGYEVTVLTSHFDKSTPTREDLNGVHVVRRPVLLKLGKGVIMPTFWWDAVRYSRRNDYTCLQLPMADTGLSSLFIPRRKLITTYHCDIFLGNGILDRLITFVSTAMVRLQIARSRAVVPSSRDYIANSKMKKYTAKAVPIYPPIPVTEYNRVDSRGLFRSLGIKEQEIKIGFVGRIVYEKGIDYLLASIPHLQKRFKNFRIIIMGDYENVAGGSIKDQLDHFIAKYPENILFTGYLSDKKKIEFYSGIDVFVLPSIDPLEAFGMVQVEAMLCGAPVVASNLPGVREVIRRTGYGRISKLKNPKDIAKQIVEVVTHSKKYKPVREKVIELFSQQHTIDAYANIMPKE